MILNCLVVFSVINWVLTFNMFKATCSVSYLVIRSGILKKTDSGNPFFQPFGVHNSFHNNMSQFHNKIFEVHTNIIVKLVQSIRFSPMVQEIASSSPVSTNAPLETEYA